MTNTTTTAIAPRAIYAGIGWPETPRTTLADMTRIARWLHRTGWHLNTGGAPGAEQAFVDGTPSGARTRYLPWDGYNGHTGPDCHVRCPAMNARPARAWRRSCIRPGTVTPTAPAVCSRPCPP